MRENHLMNALEFPAASPVVHPHHPVNPPLALSIHDLTVIYNDLPALEGASLEIHQGERVAIIGPNGAGKSTLIKAMMGLLQPRTGSVRVHSSNLHCLGYVPQYEAVNWDFPVTVRDVVMMGQLRRIGWLRWPGREHQHTTEEALARVGLTEFAGRQVGQLSGGQRRRVFIARALAQQAEILILDEPFSGVDASAQESMMDVLDMLHRDGLTIVLSTHDLNLAFQRFDKVLALKRHMIAYGTPTEIYTPDVLTQLYGGRLATWDNGRQVTVIVDDHDCC